MGIIDEKYLLREIAEIKNVKTWSREFLRTELNEHEYKNAIVRSTLNHNSNRQLLQHFNQKAYKVRYEKSLRLNPHNTEGKIKEFMWFYFKPEEYKNAERMKKRIETASNVFGFEVEQIRAIDRVFYQKTILETKSGGGGHSVSEILCKTTEDTEFTAYEFMAWWTGGDDAGEWSEIYDKLPPAVSHYHELNREPEEHINAIREATDNFAVFERHNCWETGIDYYELRVRVPEDVFKSLNLTYHSEEIEEEGDWKDWYTTDHKGTLEKIKALNWTSNL